MPESRGWLIFPKGFGQVLTIHGPKRSAGAKRAISPGQSFAFLPTSFSRWTRMGSSGWFPGAPDVNMFRDCATPSW